LNLKEAKLIINNVWSFYLELINIRKKAESIRESIII
jgi:hypothetical protein